MHDLVNLRVDLSNERFGSDALARALQTIEGHGFSVDLPERADDAFFAWIDAEFGGSWSSEALAGKNIVARAQGRPAGFVTYDARGLPFSWLRGLGAEPGVGIFGPFGVVPEHRGGSLGPSLLIAGLASLRKLGYERALVPAVGGEKLIAYYQTHAGAVVAERFDAASRMARRFRTVVLASGSGSNFQSVVDAVAARELPLEITLLLSNKPAAFALERARSAGITARSLVWDRTSQTRAAYDAGLLELVQSEQPDLVLLLGWMHLLDDNFVAAFPHMINIHPAFLPLDQRRDEVVFPDGTVTPAFRGANAVRDALAWGSRWVGASCHRVTLDADRGPVLVRKPLAIAPGEAQEQIMERLHPLEHRVLAAGIKRWTYER